LSSSTATATSNTVPVLASTFNSFDSFNGHVITNSADAAIVKESDFNIDADTHSQDLNPNDEEIGDEDDEDDDS